MKITVFGSGYVGLVTGICLSDKNNYVIGVDIIADKIEKLNQGCIPIYELGLEEILKRNLQKNISFTTESVEAIKQSEILFICVGTPSKEDGSADLQYIFNVAKNIGQHIDEKKIIVIKSTVPVGTNQKVHKIIQDELDKREKKIYFDIISNPEFLKEGSSVNDFYHGDRIIIGGQNQTAMNIIRELYKKSCQIENIIFMDNNAAELVKYASNVFLANKISYINLLSQFSDAFTCDIDDVKKGLISDPRIGKNFLNPGIGYGGSCFPKDVEALASQGAECNLDVSLIQNIKAINSKQRIIFIDKIMQYYENNIENKTFAVWGLSFKPDTDDVREAPSIDVVKHLIKNNTQIHAYDPLAQDNFSTYFTQDELKCIQFFENKEDALRLAHALIILNEKEEFKLFSLNFIHKAIIDNIIFDGRNIFDKSDILKNKINYISIGQRDIIIK